MRYFFYDGLSRSINTKDATAIYIQRIIIINDITEMLLYMFMSDTFRLTLNVTVLITVMKFIKY